MDHHHCRACGGLCKVHNPPLFSEILRRQFEIEKLFKETVLIMSNVSEAVKIATDAVNANLTLIQDNIIALNDDVVKLQALNLTTAGGGGIMAAADQALLDGIVARSASLAKLAADDLAQRFPVASPVAPPAPAPAATAPALPVTPSGDGPNVPPVVTEVSAPPAMAGSVPAPRTSTPDGSAPVAPPPFVMGTPAVAPAGNVPPAAPTKPAGE